jgi:hypothetical protein
MQNHENVKTHIIIFPVGCIFAKLLHEMHPAGVESKVGRASVPGHVSDKDRGRNIII